MSNTRLRSSAFRLLGTLAVPLSVHAQPTPPAKIDACYVPASGTIYRIDTEASPAPGAPKACLSQTHVKFTWNQQGVAGPAGPKGDKGDAGTGGTLGPDIDLPGLLTMGKTGTFGGGLLAAAGTDLTVPSGAGSRFMWVPQKSAIRAGRAQGAEWNADQIGNYSTAFGRAAQASGAQSFAAGINVTANGESSVALGSNASTNGQSGTFVYGDGNGTTVAADAPNQFLVRAAGGVRLRTAANLSKGCDVDAQGGIGCTGGVVAGGNGSVLVPSGAGKRMMWIPQKSAFRAGAVGGAQWDDVNIGDGSIALGASAQATGANSVAIGLDVTASGAGSVALGRDASTNGHTGTFVYGDNGYPGAVVKAGGDNQFVVRAIGGLHFRTAVAGAEACHIVSGTIGCSDGLNSDVMIRTRQGDWTHVDAGSRDKGTLPCPAGTVIMGGGAETDAYDADPTTLPTIMSTYPRFDDNSWVAVVKAGSLNGTNYRLYAVCMLAKSGVPAGF